MSIYNMNLRSIRTRQNKFEFPLQLASSAKKPHMIKDLPAFHFSFTMAWSSSKSLKKGSKMASFVDWYLSRRFFNDRKSLSFFEERFYNIIDSRMSKEKIEQESPLTIHPTNINWFPGL